jgi:hypothetical protein
VDSVGTYSETFSMLFYSGYIEIKFICGGLADVETDVKSGAVKCFMTV